MDDFERELKVGFLEEAEQAVADVEQCFLILEENPNDKPTLDKIFRLAHNLKGSAKAVGFDEMGAFTHELESYMLTLKTGVQEVRPATVNLLLRCNDQIQLMVQSLKADLTASVDSSELIAELQRAQSGDLGSGDFGSDVSAVHSEVPDSAAFEEEEEAAPHQFAAEASHDNSIEVEANGVSEPAAPAHPVAENVIPLEAKKAAFAPAAAKSPVAGNVDESIRVSLSRVEKLLNYVGEMVILQAVLNEQVGNTTSLLMKKTVHQLGKVTKEIQDMSMSLRMVPVKPTFQKMQRIVRDTAQALNKTVHLQLIGEDTELDKTVLERMNDPLVHLVRNSVDHGIEDAETRISKGKKPEGTVSLSAYHQSGKLVIEVKDDGGGLNGEKLKSIAIAKGILKPNAQLTEREAWNLIFAPGFSTKPQATDISGRGVGMDVVRTNIEELNGEISIDSELGVGTTFRVFLPLTLAIIDGMVVRVGEERFVIPLSHVHESVRPFAKDIKYATGLGEVFMLRGENLPLYKLGALLGRKSSSNTEDQIAVVVRVGDLPFAILVDDIIGQYQVVIKQLGPEVRGLRGVSGSTILGDGKPALILEPVDLVRKDSKTMGREGKHSI
jgi:two-component system, chemotaxis family, sensor kinase CheA